MGTIRYIFLVCCMFVIALAQGQEFIISSNSKISALPGTTLVFGNGMNVVNNSSYRLGGTYVFRGTLPQKISGTQPVQITNLKVEQGAMLSLFSDVKVDSSLNLNGGIINLLGNNLILLRGASIKGSFGETNMIAASGDGKLSLYIQGNGAYLFPIGDTVKTDDYTPATLNFKTGTYDSAYVSINLRNTKHPNNQKSTNYLDRYWVVSQQRITNFDCDVSFVYTNEDIKGTEANIYGAKWDGAAWTTLNKASLNSITGNVNGFSDFTGADQTLLAEKEIIQDKVEVLVSGKMVIIRSKDNIELKNAEIFNRLGQKIMATDLSKSNYNEINLNIASDLYLLKVSSDKQSFTKKILID